MDTLNSALSGGPQDIPTWVESLKWIFAALILAVAVVGPKLFGPFLDRFRSTRQTVAASTSAHTAVAVVGGALADKDSMLTLAGSIDRLCDILERKQKWEEQEEESERIERVINERIRRAMDTLDKRDKK